MSQFFHITDNGRYYPIPTFITLEDHIDLLQSSPYVYVPSKPFESVIDHFRFVITITDDLEWIETAKTINWN